LIEAADARIINDIILLNNLHAQSQRIAGKPKSYSSDKDVKTFRSQAYQHNPPSGPRKLIGVEMRHRQRPWEPISQQVTGSSDNIVCILPTMQQVPQTAMGMKKGMNKQLPSGSR
jgi:hypothetical protein